MNPVSPLTYMTVLDVQFQCHSDLVIGVVFSLYAISRLQRLPPGIMTLLTSSVKSTRIVVEFSRALCYAIKKKFHLVR